MLSSHKHARESELPAYHEFLSRYSKKSSVFMVLWKEEMISHTILEPYQIL